MTLATSRGGRLGRTVLILVAGVLGGALLYSARHRQPVTRPEEPRDEPEAEGRRDDTHGRRAGEDESRRTSALERRLALVL